MNRLYIYLLSGFIAAVLLYVLLQAIPGKPVATDPKKQLEEAQHAYKEGERAQTVFERKSAFNHALTLYMDLERKYQPDFGNGKLYYNIANTFYQLDEVPLAIYYYNQAARLAPRDKTVQINLSQAGEKLQLKQQTDSTFSGKNFTLASFLSLPERLCLFFWTLATLFVLASLFIWKRANWLKIPIVLVGTLAIYLLATLLYTRFIAPQEGVLIQSSMLYRDAGAQYAKVTPEPAPAGLKVEVITIRDDGAWIKILTPEGTLGYVSSDRIKLL